VLLDWLVDAHGLPATEVANMRDLYERNGLIAEAHDAVRSFTARAESDVAAHFDESARQSLTDFAEMLLERNS